MPSMFRFKKRGRLPYIAGDQIYAANARLDFSQCLVDSANTDGGVIKAGTSTAPVTEDTADFKFISLYFDNGATSGDNRGFYNRFYLTGAGGGGESFRTYTTVSNVAGSTAHGAHISLDFAATGSITGLGVAGRNTLHIPDAALGGGTYAALQAEIYSDGASSTPATATKLSFLRFTNDGNGTGVAAVEDKAFLFEISNGTSDTGNMVYGATARVDVLGNTRYLIFSTAENALTISGVAVTAGAGSFTTMGLSDALTFSDGATIDNTASDTLTITEDNVIIAGNLQVDGTTTTVNTATLTVDDKNIELGSVASPTDTTADGGGITLLGATNKTILWDNANDNWSFNQAVNLVTGLDFKINNVSVLNATTLGSSVVASSLTSVGTLTSLTVSGATAFYGGSTVIGFDVGAALTIAVTDETGVAAITHAGSGPTVTWTANSFSFVGAFSTDSASTAVIDGATSFRGVSAGFVSLEADDIRFGFDASVYMTLATTTGTGAVAISHTGTAPAITWTADSLDFTGAFGVDSASTVVLDGTTSVRGISAGFVSLEGPDIRFGCDATDYMKIAVTTGTGDVAITHTGTNKAVTWTAAAGFDFVGAIALDGVTISGAVGMADDQVFTIGTTTATAETVITMEFDETTTGIGYLQLGSSSAPMVYNTSPGATPQPAIDVNITHSAGAGDAVWCSGILSKMIISGDGDSDSKLRAFRGEAVVSGAVSSVYTGMFQATHSSADDVSGAMAALNCDFRVTDSNFEGVQTLQTALFTMTADQARTVTCTSENMNVVLVKNASAITGIASLLKLSSAGAADPTNHMIVDGAATHFIRFSAGASAVCIPDTGSVPGSATHKIKCMDAAGAVFYLVGVADL